LKTFKDALARHDFVATAEIYLRPESTPETICAQCDVLAGYVDGILLTDNQYGQLHMSTLAAASILLSSGVDPIVQLSSRNRNRIALLSELMGAAAVGVSSLVLVAGEKPPKELSPRPKPVLDVNAAELIRIAATLKQDERLQQVSDFLVGGVVTPILPGPNWKPKKLLEKIDAGAQFVVTHLCMDVDLLTAYMGYLVQHKFTQRTRVIVTVAVLESSDDARWLIDNRSNVMLPKSIIERLDNAEDAAAEGIQICAETVRTLSSVPGIDGVNLIATRNLDSIPKVVDVVSCLNRIV